MNKFAVSVFSIASFFIATGHSISQTYPAKPIHIIYSGGTQEIIARIVGDAISKSLGQPVVPEGRPSVVIAAETVAHADPDGHTVLLTGGNFHLTPLTRETNYDPIEDFRMVTIVGRAPLVLYATPSLDVSSVEELIAVAKERPLDSAIGGLGGGSHLALEQLNTLAGVKITAIPYAAGAQEMTDLLSGRVHMTFAPPSPYMTQVEAGELVALGVTSLTPSAVVPGLPAIADTVPELERINMTIMAVPKDTPAEVVARLNEEVVKALNTDEVKKLILAAGLEIGGDTPEEADRVLADDVAKLSAQIKAMGLELK